MTKPFAIEELEARIELVVARATTPDVFLSGSVAHLPVSDLLQILALNGKNGTVVLKRGDDEGRIEFAEGRIVDATVGEVHGTKVLFRMLGWADATFRVVAREGWLPPPTISTPTATLLMDAVLALDEWARWEPLLPDLAARLALTGDAPSVCAGSL
jgi:hypothetical protein